ncbi:alpha/beta hydrolase [Sphingomonas canadensis]|uniref:Alpha/beta hydrolase n=1 Tax=Sphingomonas canadensis TaxID=1219257 RepID=A0ABW3HE22_9SPHN|nr:alpha/beta hydrolase [Sphingomonas canadensis]MCW3838195.1 alpha/beta hydrolase [Sphingomonas canadensis]
MTPDPHAVRGTRPMVAPEVAPGLELFPTRDIDADMLAAIRAAGPLFPPPPLSAEEAAVRREERFVPGPAGGPGVRVLFYTPPGTAAAPRPAYLHMHGGGYILGNADFSDKSNRAFAAALDAVVVSVDYRLAPETRWPGPVEDCHAALVWLHGDADALGVDRARIAIGGESAGGGLAAMLALMARDRGQVPVCFQYLDSPMLDDRTGSASDPHPYAGEFIWTAASNRFGWSALLGCAAGSDAVPAGAVPARVANLASLPPAYIAVGALDLFVEEDIEYARRLIRAGVPAELHVTPGIYHGFTVAGPDTPQARRHIASARAAFARAFAPEAAPAVIAAAPALAEPA